MRKARVIPGFGLTLGLTVSYLSIIVLIPIGALVLRMTGMSWAEFVGAALSRRAVAAYTLSLTTALGAAVVNAILGSLTAWVLVRYRFPGRRILDGLIDLPFALPTAVAGITLTTLYAPQGWIGGILAGAGIKVAFTPLGILVALVFVGLPFVVRTVQPVLEDVAAEVEEAASSLGANRLQVVGRVLLPEIYPALLTGFTLAFARCLGEYGSVIFIAGNLPMKTEITPLLIMIQLEQYDYAEAAAVAVVFLAISFVLLLAVNLLERRLRPRTRSARAATAPGTEPGA